MILPNFIIAGVICGGTSYLSTALKQHPDIYLPRIQRPEPNFFHYTWKYQKGIKWYSKELFSEISDEHSIGERSSLLLTSEVAISRIKKHIPNTKLIFSLRNPIERAWANYRYTVLEGLENLSFEDALNQEKTRKEESTGKWKEVLPYAYLERSFYSHQLTRYIEEFGEKNILIVCSEDLSKNPSFTLSKICDFLDVSNDFNFQDIPNYSSPSVINISLQEKLRNYFGDRYADISECIREEQDLEKLVIDDDDRIKIYRLRDNLKKGKDPINNNDRQKLQNLLGKEIEEVEKIVDFSIKHWK